MKFIVTVVSNTERFAPHANIIHIDVDPAEINKNVRAYSSVKGDLKEILTLLNDGLNVCDSTEWMEKIRHWKEKYPLRYKDSGALRAQQIIEKIYELTKGDAIITTEVGQNQIWASQCYTYTKPRSFISSGGLGTMGFGLGAAIGAQLGVPNKRVFNIAGDGSFRMNCNELATAVYYNLPIITVILNNHVLGMVRQWQSLFYGGRYSHTSIDRKTDFIKLAEAYDAVGFELKDIDDIESILQKAIDCNRPVIINCEIDKDDKVFPMVPPGAGIDEIIMEGEI